MRKTGDLGKRDGPLEEACAPVLQDWQAGFWQVKGGADAKGNWLNVRRDLGLTGFRLPKARLLLSPM